MLPVLAATENHLVVEATPALAAQLAGAGPWAAWKSPASGWPGCPAAPAASDPDAALVSVGVDLSLWPAPGPAAGDTAVLAWHPGGCAVVSLPVLGATDTRLVVEATPAVAEGLAPYQWWAWESPPGGWPACEG